MAELSTSQTPPGGWQFVQPQTNWSAPTPVASTFDQTVILILKHRQANPVIVASHKLSIDKGQIAHELLTYTKARLGITDAVSDPPAAAPAKRGACCGG